MKTLQETFDTVVSHLRQQGRQAIHNHKCVYRSPDGLRCAAGCLIPDEDYERRMEGQSIHYVDKETLSLPGQIIQNQGHDVVLVQSLQASHDNNTPSEWEISFAGIANRFGLKYTSPTKKEKI